MSLSTRTLYFISGNPHYDHIRKGIIEFYEDIRLDRALTCDTSTLTPPTSTGATNTTLDSLIQSESHSSHILQCILTVPAFMIHEEILKYLSSILHAVKSISILRHYSDQDQYFVILLMDSASSSLTLVNNFHGRIMSSLQPTTCMIYTIKNIYILNDDLTHVPFYIRGIKYDGLLLPGSLSESKSQQEQETSEEVCTVCLEPIVSDSPNCLTTCCNHTFHISCLIPLESSQCPVCRFEHDSTTSLSVCSICSIVSSTPHMSDPTDTWVCLVCGFIGCGSRGMNHSQRHYQDHLHAYAMNTETKRVWDYAGEGYVHRLILSRPDNAESTSGNELTISPLSLTHQSSGESKDNNSQISRSKIVEVSNPRDASDYRSQYPPMTQAQEDYLVSRKLESAAEHYSGILAWQLEQQREYFESQLAKLRSFTDFDRKPGNSTKDHGGFRRIEQSLLQERINLMKQKETAETRLQRVEKEILLLEDFNSNLEMNSEKWIEKAEEAAKHLQDVEGSYRNSIAILERKIRTLMQQIDETDEQRVNIELSDNS